MSAVFAWADLRRARLTFLAFSLLAPFFFLNSARIFGERFFRPKDLLTAVVSCRFAFLAELDDLILLFRICMPLQQNARLGSRWAGSHSSGEPLGTPG
jgi:hypothetical protein